MPDMSTAPDDRFIGFPAIFARLRVAGYAVWVIREAEQDPAKANPSRYAKPGHRNLALTLRQAGFQLT